VGLAVQFLRVSVTAFFSSLGRCRSVFLKVVHGRGFPEKVHALHVPTPAVIFPGACILGFLFGVCL
jgi:hypothetical protein